MMMNVATMTYITSSSKIMMAMTRLVIIPTKSTTMTDYYSFHICVYRYYYKRLIKYRL